MALPSIDLSAFAQARVLVVGDVMLDRFVYGEVQRISPEAPIPVLRVTREISMPGGAGNVARNIASLGGRAFLFGLAGDDAAADALNDALATTPGIEAHLVVDEARPTAEKARLIGQRQQLLRVDREEPGEPSAEALAVLQSSALEALEKAQVLVLSDYAKGALSAPLISKLIAAAKKSGKIVLVDPKGSDYARYRGADIITPNQKEAALASGLACDNNAQAEAAGRALMQAAGVEAALITRGPAGMSLVSSRSNTALHLAAEAREVFDVSGAGDTVVAALAVALASGLPLPVAARIANIAAGVAVAKLGTAVVLPEELRAALHVPDPHGIDDKVAGLERAQALVANWRARGERIGFTNGVFDLLHSGHLALLSEARSRCDRLIVAINADASVKRLKGESRPVQDETHRARLLAALSLVDLVIVFTEDTPIPLLQALQPDLLIKGGDYTVDQVVGADIVQGYGGQVMVSHLLPGHSTTSTIQRLKA